MTILPKIKGFDHQGEPELRHGPDGTLELVFNFMPPMTSSGEAREAELFEQFETELSNVLGVSVTRDDRESFLITAPKSDTAEVLTNYLSTFWKAHAKPLKAAQLALPRPANAPFRNNKDFNKAARESLLPLLKPLGFKKAAGSDIHFVKKTETGSALLVLGAHQLVSFFDPYAIVFVRHDLVEEIFSPLSDDEPKYWKSRHTFFSALDIPKPEGSCKLRNPSDLSQWSESIATYLRDTGIGLIKQLGDTEVLEQRFNRMSEPPEYMHQPQGDRWASKGLILAKLLDRSNISDVAAFHRQSLSVWDVPTTYPQVEAYVLSTSKEAMISGATNDS
jgi:hypothetical protein